MIKLPPGFRFHPTDEELVVQYLRRKALSYPLPAAIIPEIDLLKFNPWDLPGKFEFNSQLPSSSKFLFFVNLHFPRAYSLIVLNGENLLLESQLK